MASKGGENHVLFISDSSRCWLNAPGMAERIVAVIEATAKEIGADQIVGLGNSMGATMLLHLSHLTEFDTILAFSPQYSVDPAIVPEEKRWNRFRRDITTFRFPAVQNFRVARTRYVILHGDAETELIHALRFPDTKGVSHMLLPGYGHRLAEVLKKEGKLSALVSLAISGRHARLHKLLLRFGGLRRHTFARERGAPDPRKARNVA